MNYRVFCWEYLVHRIPQNSCAIFRKKNLHKFNSNWNLADFLDSLLICTENVSFKEILLLLFSILEIYTSDTVLWNNVLPRFSKTFLNTMSLGFSWLFFQCWVVLGNIVSGTQGPCYHSYKHYNNDRHNLV